MLSKFFALNAYAVLAVAAIFVIDVSTPSGAITFSPNSVIANQGDTVAFNWQAGGHNVVQGQGSSTACQPCGWRLLQWIPRTANDFRSRGEQY